MAKKTVTAKTPAKKHGMKMLRCPECQSNEGLWAILHFRQRIDEYGMPYRERPRRHDNDTHGIHCDCGFSGEGKLFVVIE